MDFVLDYLENTLGYAAEWETVLEAGKKRRSNKIYIKASKR